MGRGGNGDGEGVTGCMESKIVPREREREQYGEKWVVV